MKLSSLNANLALFVVAEREDSTKGVEKERVLSTSAYLNYARGVLISNLNMLRLILITWNPSNSKSSMLCRSPGINIS